MNIFTAILRVVPTILMAVKVVESMTNGLKGPAKQDAAIQIVRDVTPVMYDTLDQNVLQHEDVERAMRAVIDAVVALMNVAQKVRG